MNTKLVRKRVKATILKTAIVLALGSVTVLSPNAYANDTANSRSNLTYVAKPYDKSKNYMIYEFGFKTQVSGPRNRNEDVNRMLTVDLGMMHNLNDKFAIGASLYGSTSDYAATLGIRARVRRWLDNSRGIDVSAGLLFTGNEGGGYGSNDYKWPGFISSVSVDMFRWLSVDLSLETLRNKDYRSFNSNGSFSLNKGESVTSLYIGVNGKDYAALAETGALVALLVIVLATWDSGSGWTVVSS